MGSVVIFLNCNGTWDHNNYYGTETTDILVLIGATYRDLLETVFETLELRPENNSIEMKYFVNAILAPIKIINDCSVKAYMKLKKIEVDKSKFPLCIDIIDEPVTMQWIFMSPIQSQRHRQ
ncbi:hypothetical protein PanWU01x14_249120 [Parasponia andersonii]|uniref:Uncharacterized protein n=1 Tax=Parasponia andersonii TaxID=3476 RepID=A0A2P5BDE3_PARAD|nr:hypothetical protein PanWU01x14_249120 [Parasponia andersonii]